MGCYGNIGLMRFNRDLMGIWLGFDRDFMFGKWNFNHPIHGSRKILEIMRLFLELNMGPDRWCTLYHEDIWGLFGFVCPMKCQKRNMNLDMNGTVLGNEIFGLSGSPWLQTNTLPLQDFWFAQNKKSVPSIWSHTERHPAIAGHIFGDFAPTLSNASVRASLIVWNLLETTNAC